MCRDVLSTWIPSFQVPRQRIMEGMVAGAGRRATGLIAMQETEYTSLSEEAGDFRKELTEQWDHHRAPRT